MHTASKPPSLTRIVLTAAAALAALLALALPAAMAPDARAAEDGAARVRAIHAIPDLGPVDIYVDGVKQLGDVPFFTVSSYLELAPGQVELAVTEAGEPLSHGNILLSGTVTVEAGQDYSIIARGSTTSSVGLTTVEDENGPPAVGEARLRVAHFSPDAPAVDILVDGARVVTNLSFQEVSGYLSVPAGSYSVGVAPTGGAPIATFDVTLEAGKVYTAWANGLLAGSGAQAFTVTPTIDASYTQTAGLRVLHASPDAPAVDVFVDGTLTLEGLAFGEITDYLRLYAGSYAVEIRAAGGGPSVFSGTLALEAGQDYTVAARGLLDAPSPEAAFGVTVLEDDNSPPSPGKAKVRFVHFSPNAPAVDVRVGETVLFDDISYNTASGYIEADPAALTADVTTSDGAVTVLSAELDLAPGSVTTVFALGLVGDDVPAGQELRALAKADVSTVRAFAPVVFR
jgi:hypothetical protein